MRRAKRLGVDTVLTPIHAPRANAIAERVIGTLRRECLDHTVILSERHRGAVLGELARYYNRERPHRTLRLETPQPMTRSTTGPVVVRPVLVVLHHTYERTA